MMVRTGSILLAAMLASVAGQAAAQSRSGPLLAGDLYLEQYAPNRRAVLTIDPALAGYPAVVRQLRGELAPNMSFADEECGRLGCYRSIQVERAAAGRLVSVFITTDQYLGGAHGAVRVESRLYDTQTGRRVPFQSLFIGWPAAKRVIDDRMCAALRRARSTPGLQCPAAEEVAIAPSEADELPIDTRAHSFEIRTSDYQLGSYADGRETVVVQIDAGLLVMIRPEYRASFRAVRNR